MDRPVIDGELLDMIDEFEFEVVDVPPDDLLGRIREQKILAPAQLARAMQRELRPQVLAMLRETMLRIATERVDREFVTQLRAPDTGVPAEVRGRVVLCLPVRTGQEERIRAAAKTRGRTTPRSRSSPSGRLV